MFAFRSRNAHRRAASNHYPPISNPAPVRRFAAKVNCVSDGVANCDLVERSHTAKWFQCTHSWYPLTVHVHIVCARQHFFCSDGQVKGKFNFACLGQCLMRLANWDKQILDVADRGLGSPVLYCCRKPQHCWIRRICDCEGPYASNVIGGFFVRFAAEILPMFQKPR